MFNSEEIPYDESYGRTIGSVEDIPQNGVPCIPQNGVD